MMDTSSATVMLGLKGMAVLAVSERDGETEYAIQTTASTGWCPVCGAQVGARRDGRRCRIRRAVGSDDRRDRGLARIPGPPRSWYACVLGR